MQNNNNIQKQSDDDIDLIELAKTIWNGRKTIIITTIVFMAIGLFVAIFSENEYTASCTIVPQSSEGGSKLGGSLGGLAAMAGINLGSMGGGSTIPPALYPKIVNSIPFQKQLMKTPLTIEGQSEMVTFSDYYLNIKKPGLLDYIKKYTIGLPGLLLKSIRGEAKAGSLNPEAGSLGTEAGSLITISSNEKQLISLLSTQLSLNVNDQDGYISLSASMPQAKAAAQLAKQAQELLQKAITDFKIQKAKDQLIFVQKNFVEKQQLAQAAQEKLANFRDRNRNVTTAMAQTEQDRLMAEYNLAQGVYSELAKQVETQKIQVKEDTPVFTIIEPVAVPIEKAKPKRAMILIIWTFLGGIFGVGAVFGKGFFRLIKEQWRR